MCRVVRHIKGENQHQPMFVAEWTKLDIRKISLAERGSETHTDTQNFYICLCRGVAEAC